jgi:transposase
MTPAAIAAARAEIAAAFGRNPHRRLRSRLLAIDAVLAGDRPEAVSNLVSMAPCTLQRWLRQIRKHGIAPLLLEWEHLFRRPYPVSQAESAALHARADKEINMHVRKRLRAVACVLEGVEFEEAAARVGLSPKRFRQNLRRYQEDGAAALCQKPYPGPGPNLRPNELQAVAALTERQQPMPVEQLCQHIEAEFGVRYTPSGLKHMLKTQLGFVYTDTYSRT